MTEINNKKKKSKNGPIQQVVYLLVRKEMIVQGGAEKFSMLNTSLYLNLLPNFTFILFYFVFILFYNHYIVVPNSFIFYTLLKIDEKERVIKNIHVYTSYKWS